MGDLKVIFKLGPAAGNVDTYQAINEYESRLEDQIDFNNCRGSKSNQIVAMESNNKNTFQNVHFCGLKYVEYCPS